MSPSQIGSGRFGVGLYAGRSVTDVILNLGDETFSSSGQRPAAVAAAVGFHSGNFMQSLIRKQLMRQAFLGPAPVAHDFVVLSTPHSPHGITPDIDWPSSGYTSPDYPVSPRSEAEEFSQDHSVILAEKLAAVDNSQTQPYSRGSNLQTDRRPMPCSVTKDEYDAGPQQPEIRQAAGQKLPGGSAPRPGLCDQQEEPADEGAPGLKPGLAGQPVPAPASPSIHSEEWVVLTDSQHFPQLGTRMAD